jgi:hypothetical protein
MDKSQARLEIALGRLDVVKADLEKDHQLDHPRPVDLQFGCQWSASCRTNFHRKLDNVLPKF